MIVVNNKSITRIKIRFAVNSDLTMPLYSSKISRSMIIGIIERITPLSPDI